MLRCATLISLIAVTRYQCSPHRAADGRNRMALWAIATESMRIPMHQVHGFVELYFVGLSTYCLNLPPVGLSHCLIHTENQPPCRAEPELSTIGRTAFARDATAKLCRPWVRLVRTQI